MERVAARILDSGCAIAVDHVIVTASLALFVVALVVVSAELLVAGNDNAGNATLLPLPPKRARAAAGSVLQW